MGGSSTTEQQQPKLTFLFNPLFNALGSKRERKKLFSLVCMVMGYFLAKNAQKIWLSFGYLFVSLLFFLSQNLSNGLGLSLDILNLLHSQKSMYNPAKNIFSIFKL